MWGFAVHDLIFGREADFCILQLCCHLRNLTGAALGKGDVTILNQAQILSVSGEANPQLFAADLSGELSVQIEFSVFLDVHAHGSKPIARRRNDYFKFLQWDISANTH